MMSQEAASGTVGKIPVRNLWLLMLYATKLFREIPSNRRYAVEESPDDIPNLVAEILSRAVERRLRRNLSSDFRHRQADLTRVRGRINLLRTQRRRLLQQGKIACSFDELTTDTLANRFVKAALLKLTRTVQDSELTKRCRTAAATLERAGVGNFPSLSQLRRAIKAREATWRTVSEDQRMMEAARLAFELALPSEDPGRARLPAPDRDELWARRLFEAAVGGFYDTVLSSCGWNIGTGRKINWQIAEATPGMAAILPSMETDIVLERPLTHGQEHYSRTIIDTKFTNILIANQYGKPSLRSAYIYQIYAYLRSQEREDDPSSVNSSGMLLHPSVDIEVDEEVTIQGHRIRFATVDLAANTRAIRNRLLTLAQAVSPAEIR